MTIESNIDGQILTWRINRPERGNSLGTSIAKLLSNEMKNLKSKLKPWESKDFARDEAPCRILIIEAVNGGKNRDIWIAGGDLLELSKLKKPSEGRAYAESLCNFCKDLEELPIPVIAKINGAAIGGGAELALACDLRVGGPLARFEFKQLLVGLATGYGSSRRLVETVGLARAKSLMFQCKTIPASECFTQGILTEISPSQSELDHKIKQITDNMVKLEPKSLVVQKRMFRKSTGVSSDSLYNAELDLFESLWMNPTHEKFLKNFPSKNTPQKP